MRKLFLFLLIAACTASHCFSQIVNVQLGFSTSKLDWIISPMPEAVYKKPVTNLFAAIGIDYANRKYFNLSSNIGYLVKGGGQAVTYTNDMGNTTSTEIHKGLLRYISLNTLVEAKIPGNKLIPFICVGPRIDLLVSKSDYLPKKDLNEVSYGAIAGAGLKYPLLNKFQIGLRGSYLFNFNKIHDGYDIKDKTFVVNVSFGFKI
jgi:hypothetical protein